MPHRTKTFIEANSTNNNHIAKDFLAVAAFGDLLVVSFQTEQKRCSVSVLWIYKEETIKELLLMRSKFIFLFVNSSFDLPKCKFLMKNGSSKYWLFFRLFLWRTQK